MRLDILASTLSQRTVQIDRPVYTEDDLLQLYSNSEEKEKSTLRSKCSKKLTSVCTCSTLVAFIVSFFPVISWLPRYQFRTDIVRDLSAGLTLGVIQIPQGMAYGMLTTLPPIYGLYVSFIPVLIYFVFGTSKHLSIGTFAIISLMVGEVVENSVAPMFATVTTTNSNGTVVTDSGQQELDMRVKYAVTVSFMVGVFQVLFGCFRFGFITIFLSDPLISGFTTAAGFFVFTSQVKSLVGMNIPRKEVAGVFGLFKHYIYIFKHITKVNYASFIVGVVATVLLFIIKFLSEKYKAKLKVPIPAELIIVILGTGLSYGLEFNTRFDISILEDVPASMPPMTVPMVEGLDKVIVDCLIIAVVSYVISVSIAKSFAKKNKYLIDANQELFAHGFVNIFCSFFSCFVASASLSRSLIQENLGSTQVCGLFACVLIVLTLTVLAPLFNALPRAILAAIVLVALKGLFKQFSVVKSLSKISKVDTFVWITSFVAVICLGVDYGLGVGLVINLLTTVARLSRPSVSSLGHIKHTGIYTKVNRNNVSVLEEVPGVSIFQFHAPLLYINVDHFQETLFHTTVNPSHCISVPTPKCYLEHNLEPDVDCGVDSDSSSDEGGIFYINSKNGKTSSTSTHISTTGESRIRRRTSSLDVHVKTASSPSKHGKSVAGSVIVHSASPTQPRCPLHTIILDCSQISYADTMGVGMLVSVCSEFKNLKVDVLLCNAPMNLLKILHCGGYVEMHGLDTIFVSVHDAVQFALAKRHLSGVCNPDQEKMYVDSLCSSESVDVDDKGTSSAQSAAGDDVIDSVSQNV